MILKSIYFNLNRQEYPNEYGYELLLASRFYCNFIERLVLKPLKWETENFNRIVINFTNSPNQSYINSSQVLSINIKFNKEEYEDAKKSNIAEYFIKYLEYAIESIQKEEIDLPINEIKNGNKLFRLENYKNNWLYQKKKNKTLGVEAFLFCELNRNEFNLSLQLVKNKNLVYNHCVLTLDPDPVVYHYKFKDIVFKDNSVIITSRINSENLIEIKLNNE